MAFLSHKKREIRAKIVYYGPGLSGKTSNVEYIFRKMRSDHRGDLLNLSTRDRTLFFDFLPVELGNIKGYKTSFHIFTVPGQVFYNETRKTVLKDLDGLVFVADSQKKMRDDNLRSLKNLEENLAAYGYKLSDIPHVFQYNKRDMPDIMAVEELHLLLNKTGAPFFEAVATDGSGVLNTLKLISKLVLKKLATAGSAIKESEEAFEEQNYGLSSEYVALKPGEHASASVKAVTAMEIGVVVEEGPEDVEGEVLEAGVPIEEPVEAIEEAPETVMESAQPGEAYEADIGQEPADEAEIPAPPPGTEWTPPAAPEEEVAQEEVQELEPETEEPQLTELMADDPEVMEPESVEEEVVLEAPVEAEALEPETVEMPADEAVNEAPPEEEVATPSDLEVKDPAPSQPPPPTPPPNPAPRQSGQPVSGNELKLYQWGFPERIDENTMKIPIFFKDEETGEEYWSYITLGLEHIYKRH